MYGSDILCGIPKIPFEILHKIAYPYIERYDLLHNTEIPRALRSKGLYVFMKCSQDQWILMISKSESLNFIKITYMVQYNLHNTLSRGQCVSL